MAVFQKQVNLYPGIGVPGAFASVNPVVSTALGRIAAVDIPVGGFCWDDPANEGQVKNTGAGKPLGFVARDVVYPIYDLNEANPNTVPAGYNVNVQVQGDFYVQVAAAVTQGQKVFASTTDGSVSGGAAGATVSGAVETDWAFATSAAKDEIAIITNYGATPVIPPAAADKEDE